MPSVTIVGVSRDASKISRQALERFDEACWDVYPVNPQAQKIAGHAVHASISDVPEPTDVISLYVPPAVSTELLQAIKKYMPNATVIFNPGAADETTQAVADELGITYRNVCSLVAMPELTKEFAHIT